MSSRSTTGDVLIRGATVVDGTGAPGVRRDVLVRGELILAVGVLEGAIAGRIVDATGKVVAPGFIDTHVHTDMTLLDDPVHECFLRLQGTSASCGKAWPP
jgi:N-acyl-D-amino-acid deacylase